MAPTLDPTLSDPALELLCGMARQGYVRGQVPEMLFVLPDEDNAQAKLEQHEAAIGELIDKGLAGWKCPRKPGRPPAVYTHRPLNPATGREISAWLWMTTLALDLHGDALYAAYSKSGIPHMLARDEWNDAMRREVIAAPGHLAHLTQAPLPPRKPTLPKADPTPNADGFATRLGPRHSETVLHGGGLGAEDYLRVLEKWNVGRSTQLARSSGDGDDAWFQDAVIGHAGLHGIAWLKTRKMAIDTNAYTSALRHGAHPGDRIQEIISRWDALIDSGVDPRGPYRGGGTLWHQAGHGWDASLVAWMKTHQVDWTLPNDQGTLPLSLLLRHYVKTQGKQDFFENAGLFGGTSVMQMLEQAGVGVAGEIGAELDEQRQGLAFLEDLAVEMIRSGVSLTAQDNQGVCALDQVHPEQMHLQNAIAKQVPAGEDVEAAVVETMMFGDMDALRGARQAYSPAMIRFIERIEREGGVKILNESPIPLRTLRH